MNIVQANQIACHIIMVTNNLLKKLSTLNKDLLVFSLDTMQIFYRDAQTTGLKLDLVIREMV